MSDYSGYFLTGKGSQLDFYSEPLAIHPGTTFTVENNKENTILLAGGFTSIHPDSTFPLSPTLQLNGDLSSISSNNIATLAKSEFDRYNSQSFRTYTLEPDSRLTIIGTDAASLHAFIDTYGGILQIDPILSKGYDSELTTAHNILIEQKGDGLRLRFSVRQPINPSHCSYCGDCGERCPENCLTEQLFLDFSNCTLCKECITACSRDAIDLHVVENRELHTPALLPFEGAGVELPEVKSNIYSEGNLPALFEQIYAMEIEEVIRWNADSCQYSARLGTGCSICMDACVHQAIDQSKAGVTVNHLACVECGSCLSDCPTGALQYQRFDDQHFLEYFNTFSFTPGSTVVLGDESTLHKFWWKNGRKRYENVFFMEYPQPCALHAMHFLLLYAMGAANVVVLGQDHPQKQIDLTNTLILELFSTEHIVQPVENVSTLSALLEQTDKKTAINSFYHDYSYTNRREKLMDIVQFLAKTSNKEPGDLTNASCDYFGTVICDETTCTGCIACIGECRIGALTTDGNNYSLSHTPALCTQCGICVSVCPENALTLQAGLSLTDDFFHERLLAETEPAQCKGCGKVFGTKKSLEKVMSILSAKGMWDKTDDLLSYCDNCRVINLYKSSEHERANRTD